MDESNSEVESKHNPNPNPNLNRNPNLSETKVLDSSGTEAGKKGRRKSIIHKYFDKVKAEDGKLKDKCHTCGNFVSSQAQRLKKHLLKCRGKDSSIMHIISKLQVAKYTPSSNDNRPGRKTDIVRLAFEHAKDANGYNKMKCLNCGELVSNQPSRMRNHLNRCSGESEKHPQVHLNNRNALSNPVEFKAEASSRKSEIGVMEMNVSQTLPIKTSSSLALMPNPQTSSSVPENSHPNSLQPPSHSSSDPLPQHINPEGSPHPQYSNVDAINVWHPTGASKNSRKLYNNFNYPNQTLNCLFCTFLR